MYQHYFGFREKPFQLVPNPAYLFLSRSHEEAMAHLTYATSDGDGFVAITGEVGTGKTTLCRAFIESLDDKTETAYIFNPSLTGAELLQTVCDEFGIAPPAGGTTKTLIDAINRFLLEKRSQGKQVMLIIDEAQNLSRQVLEQVRLLSNLETNTEKLLQIVLFGQPEMGDALHSHELRQLSQRITLNCHLTPLTFQETIQYIRHRLRIAARNEGPVFTKAALLKIYAFSKGIPRLIHIACDRALLTAYGLGRQKITGAIAGTAVRELSLHGDARRMRHLERRSFLLLSILLGLVLVLLAASIPHRKKLPVSTASPNGATVFKLQSENPPVADSPPAPMAAPSANAADHNIPAHKVPAADTAPKASLPGAGGYSETEFSRLIAGLDEMYSKISALENCMRLWGRQPPFRAYEKKELIDPATYFFLTARVNGFDLHRMEGDLTLVRSLNLPAIFDLRVPGYPLPKFLVLSAVQENTLTFRTVSGQPVQVTAEEAAMFWSGIAYIPWINFFDYAGTTPLSGSGEDIRTLRTLLRNSVDENLAPGSDYDDSTRAAVMALQEKYNLPVDGLVGPLTKMALYNEQPGLQIPHLRRTSVQPPGEEAARNAPPPSEGTETIEFDSQRTQEN